MFTNIPNREYSRPPIAGRPNNLCLNLVEWSLASSNLEALVDGPDDSAMRQEVLIPLLIHPGYGLMERLLTDTPLQSSILALQMKSFFLNTIIHVLRIVYCVVEIQNIFLDFFLPLLQDFHCSAFIGQVLHQVRSGALVWASVEDNRELSPSTMPSTPVTLFKR
ncbi:hypothetical protein GALMADRAFT_139075 [Galerina marginata CBS 339.88]|uniref:Uncharacterized protein n=1 Tax=Galerina marginata (strain CBS 339.88) TaxID=685588 RepID=A0A067T1J3_GALM3|nr:hypothetical protein GALMADRAFT_139075 [Galerina marginata CBS 339.88]